MQTFRIGQEGIKKIRNKMLIKFLPVMLIAATMAIVINFINSKDKATDVNTLPIIIPLVLIALGFSLYRAVNRQKALFESYALTIANNLITRDQLNTPTISIYFNDITAITKHSNGTLTIKGKHPGDLITIPVEIDHYTQLQTTLQQIHPIDVKDNVSLLEKNQALTGLLTVGLMFCVYAVDNKIVVGLAGTALIVLMIWSFIKIRNSKNVDSKTKKSTWWVLLVIASVVAVMIFKLTGIAGMP